MTIEDDVVIGEEEGGLYKLKGHPKTTLIHDTTILSELCNRSLIHINYKSLPYVRKVVTSLRYLRIDHEDTCKGCATRKNITNMLSKSEIKTK